MVLRPRLLVVGVAVMTALSWSAAATGLASQPQAAAVEQLVVIYKQSPDTNVVYPEVVRAITILPGKVKQALYDSGIKIRIVPTLVDYDPTLATDTRGPRGWRAGSTFENVGGLFHIKSNSVLVAERFMPLNKPGALTLKQDAFKTVLHECGHAFDHSLGMASDSQAFKAAYEADVSSVPVNMQQRLNYFLPVNKGGIREVFATSVANEALSLSGLPPMRADVARGFPRCAQEVKRLLQ